MEINSILEFIEPELFILVIFLWCVGLFLKKLKTFFNEWQIPFILLGIGIFMSISYIGVILNQGFTSEVIISGTIQGVLISALAVFGNELIKQGIKKRMEDKKL